MRKRIKLQQNLINHVVLVLDASASMRGKERELIAVADDLISLLKEKSQSHNQETRVTMYLFGSDSQAACYDVDVLRTPTIANLYEATGSSTALIDATLKALDDLDETATLYGDHAFLVYVLTDGQENSSRYLGNTLRTRIENLPGEWTLAALVPDRYTQRSAVEFGFSLENTMIWDATSAQGVTEVGATLRNATETYFTARASGVRGTSNLFQVSSTGLTEKDVRSALVPITPRFIVPVHRDGPIKEIVQDYTHEPYVLGSTYYQLTKAEDIQPQKQLLLRNKYNGEIYGSAQARTILSLPNYTIRVAPGHNVLYDIFVQSTSVNRKLIAGTSAIVL